MRPPAYPPRLLAGPHNASGSTTNKRNEDDRGRVAVFGPTSTDYRSMCKSSEMKEYTMAEVAEHNTAEDCWLVIGSDTTGER